MKLAIIGSRSIANVNLADYITDMPTEIITGGAVGVDRIAETYAKKHGIPVTIITPDYKKYAGGAPHHRNQQIVDRSTHVLAIWDGKSNGTKNTIKMAFSAGKIVNIIVPEECVKSKAAS